LDAAHPFSVAYAHARELGWHKIADEILEISDDSTRDLIEHPNGTFSVDHEHINRARLRVDSRKWLLAKMLPHIYAEKFRLGGDRGAPLEIKFIPGDERL